MCNVRRVRFTPSAHMRCKNKCPLRARGGQQCQHKESCGAALSRFGCVKDARSHFHPAGLRLLLRRKRTPSQVERDWHASHGLGAEVPSFSHERPHGRTANLARSALLRLSDTRPTSWRKSWGSYPYTALAACDFPWKLLTHNIVYPACIMRNLTQPTIRSL